MDHDLTAARLAHTQHGLVARAQLLAAGVPCHVIEHRVELGLWEPVHRGVYRLAGAAPSWTQAICGAVLAAGEEAAASHRAAARLWELEGIVPALDVTVVRPRQARVIGVTVHRASRLDPVDLQRRHGIRVTSPTRTLIDLASVVDAEALELALDDAVTRRLTTPAYLRRRAAALGRSGRKGAATLSACVASYAGGRSPESRFERRLVQLLRAAGLPRPVLQHEVVLRDGRRARLDVAYPDRRIAFEANSYRYHAGRRGWARDNVRNRALTALGWAIIPVTWDDIDDPTELLAEVGELFRTRTGQVHQPRVAG